MSRTALALVLMSAWLPLAASADEFRQTVPARPGGTLEIDLASGSVEVRSDGDAEVHVEARTRGWGPGSMEFELESDGENVRLKGKHGGWLGIGGWTARVQVQIPERYSIVVRTGGGSVEVEELGGSADVRTSGGSIDVDGADGPLELETSGGAIRVEELRGDATLRTSGGPIRVVEAAGRVEARTSGGGIQIHDVGGPVEARTSGGSISVRFSGVAEGDLQTSGGSIEAEFAEDAAVDLDAETSGGRVRIDEDLQFVGRIERTHLVGQINGGGPELRLKTSGGNVHVRVR
jgi:DUF4097 and DUF4098 domain-containing protein YvlB